MIDSIKPQRFTTSALESSPEVRRWLSQFQEEAQPDAISMLLHLNFVSRDMYAEWLYKSIRSLPTEKQYALYAVRKFDEDKSIFWNTDGTARPRPGVSLGSEDLVYSLISNLVRGNSIYYFDHPSISVLRNRKIQNIVLIDDSIGSGTRVKNFIRSIQNHPTFLSWWSYGLLHIHILSFARLTEAESIITNGITGSNHSSRKFRNSFKVHFSSEYVYHRCNLEGRWGPRAKEIAKICDDNTNILLSRRRGYGNVMGNTVFYHSVPNNLPGSIWFTNNRWSALFPGRALPEWAVSLIGQLRTQGNTQGLLKHPSLLIIRLLGLIRSGNRRPETLALRLNFEVSSTKRLLSLAQQIGLTTPHNRLTGKGLDVLLNSTRTQPLPSYDWSLYIPTSWCVDQVDIQPPS